MLIYGFFGIVAVMLFASLAVDYGRMQVAKSEVQAAAVASARAAGQKLMNGAPMVDIVAEAISTARMNNIDGTQVTLRAGDIKLGVYFPETKTFVETSDTTVANALRIDLTHQFGRDGSPLSFVNVFSGDVRQVTARSTIMIETEGFDPSSYSYLLTTPGGSGGSPGTPGSTTGGGAVITEDDASTIVSSWTPPPVVPDPEPAPEPAPTPAIDPCPVSWVEPTPAPEPVWCEPAPEPTPAPEPVVTYSPPTPDTTWSTPPTTTVITVTAPPPPPVKKMVLVN